MNDFTPCPFARELMRLCPEGRTIIVPFRNDDVPRYLRRVLEWHKQSATSDMQIGAHHE